MSVKVLIDMPGGTKMPVISLATASLRNEAELETTLDKALKLGYRHIDTAYSYGNEKFIGNVLKKWFRSGKLKRTDVFVTTKLSTPGVHQDRVELFMEMSLEKLQLDYVDLYLIHFPIGTKYYRENSKDNYKERDDFDLLKVWKKMEEQVNAGRAKTIGLANFSQIQLEWIIEETRIKPACIQVEVNLNCWQRSLVQYCHQNGIAVVANSPLNAPSAKKIQNKNVPNVIHSRGMKKIADKYRKTPEQVTLRYLLQKNIAVAPKISNPEALKENLDVLDFVISEKDIKILDSLEGADSIPQNKCLMCCCWVAFCCFLMARRPNRSI